MNIRRDATIELAATVARVKCRDMLGESPVLYTYLSGNRALACFALDADGINNITPHVAMAIGYRTDKRGEIPCGSGLEISTRLSHCLYGNYDRISHRSV